MRFFVGRLRLGAISLFALLAANSGAAQTGRGFVSAEAYAGGGRILYVGKIGGLERIEYDKPLTDLQKIGKPYRLVFDVSETIRGREVKRVELVLSLQITVYLEHMRDRAVELLLVGGPIRLDHYPAAEMGIEEQGAPAEGQWYQFRLLDPVEVAASSPEAAIAEQINTYYDSCRMFTHQFEIVAGKGAILDRVRAFVKKHPEPTPVVTMGIPNAFGALVGSPNAYCMLTLPVCAESKTALEAVRDDPGPILRRAKYHDGGPARDWLAAEAAKALSHFPSK